MVPSLKGFKVVTQEHREHQGLEGLDGHAVGVCFNVWDAPATNLKPTARLLFFLQTVGRCISASISFYPSWCFISFYPGQFFVVLPTLRLLSGNLSHFKRIVTGSCRLQGEFGLCTDGYSNAGLSQIFDRRRVGQSSVTTHQKYSKVGIQSSAAPISR